MKGMNAQTGEPIEDFEELQQSVLDILTTPYGSRLMRRNYGAGLSMFIDMPINVQTIGQIQATLANALMTQETRLVLKEISVNVGQGSSGASNGSISVSLKGNYLPQQTMVNFNNLSIQL